MWAKDQVVLGGRFRILAPLGAGGFSEAYLAEQLSLARQVVVKTLHQGLGFDLTGRFADEVRRLASVDHPSVVRVLDFGVADGVLFVVTEEAQGVTVEAALHGEPFLPDRALALFRQLAEGLAAIHERGLLHLALRADNVFLGSTATGERARMADFGVARLLDPQAGDQRMTTLLEPVGRPEFSSPEQARGAPADARSDLYSLGVLGYLMLAGQLPFPGPSPAEFLQQHLSAVPLPLDQAAPHLEGHLRLVELVMRCLAKDPAQRPASALEVSQRLGALPEIGEPTILLEALPPALPKAVKPAAAAAPPAPGPPPVAAPAPLLPSLEVPALTPAPVAPAPIAATPTAPSADPRRTSRRAFAGAVGLGLLVIVAGLAMRARAGRVRTLLEEGQAIEALTEIDAALVAKKPGEESELLALRAAALHRLDRHHEEADVLRDRLSPKAREALDPLVLGGLAEDYGKKEEPAIRDLLKRLPRPASFQALVALARQRPSATQWGALRYLDAEQATDGVDVVASYVEALGSDACAVRRAAARRLGQLGDWAAAEPLSRLVNTPRSSTPEKSCGQDEAAEALTKLKPRVK